MPRKSIDERGPTEKVRRLRHAGGVRRQASMGSASTTDWLLLWSTGVGNANIAMLAGIGVAIRSLRQHLVRFLARD